MAVQGDFIREFLTTAPPEVGAGHPALELRGQALDPLLLLVVRTLARSGVSLHLGLAEEEKTVAALTPLPGVLVETAVLVIQNLLEK